MPLPSSKDHITYDAWIFPSDHQLYDEWKTEYDKMNIFLSTNYFDDMQNFVDTVKNYGKVVRLTPAMDNELLRRSHCSSIEEVDRMVASYRSAARRKGVPAKLASMISNNEPLPMPIVMKKNQRVYVVAGNTRLDICGILGVTPDPKVVYVDLNKIDFNTNILHESMSEVASLMQDVKYLDTAMLDYDLDKNSIEIRFRLYNQFGMVRLSIRDQSTTELTNKKFRSSLYAAAIATLGGRKPKSWESALNTIRGTIRQKAIRILTNNAEWKIDAIRYDGYNV